MQIFALQEIPMQKTPFEASSSITNGINISSSTKFLSVKQIKMFAFCAGEVKC